MNATQVVTPDGRRFVSLTEDVERLAHIYPPAEGYALYPVTGRPARYGFSITSYVRSESR